MKTAVLPAQITTVEDRITANLSLKQIILMITPVIMSGFIYFVLPPFSRLTAYKVVLSCLVMIIFSGLAYRLSGKIILDWLITRGRYSLRPRIYVYQKDVIFDDNEGENKSTGSNIKETRHQSKTTKRIHINYDQLAQLQALVHENNSHMVFKTSKKGGLNVSVSQT
jgi:hypothetical protein